MMSVYSRETARWPPLDTPAMPAAGTKFDTDGRTSGYGAFVSVSSAPPGLILPLLPFRDRFQSLQDVLRAPNLVTIICYVRDQGRGGRVVLNNEVLRLFLCMHACMHVVHTWTPCVYVSSSRAAPVTGRGTRSGCHAQTLSPACHVACLYVHGAHIAQHSAARASALRTGTCAGCGRLRNSRVPAPDTPGTTTIPMHVHPCIFATCGCVQGQPMVTYHTSRATQRAMGEAMDFMLRSVYSAGASRILTGHDSYTEFSRNVTHSLLFDTARVPSLDRSTSEVRPRTSTPRLPQPGCSIPPSTRSLYFAAQHPPL